MGGLSIGSGDFIKYIYRSLKPTYSTLQPLVDYCNCWICSVANEDRKAGVAWSRVYHIYYDKSRRLSL